MLKKEDHVVSEKCVKNKSRYSHLFSVHYLFFSRIFCDTDVILSVLLPKGKLAIFLYGMKFVLVICGFSICEFTYLLKFICNPQINTLVLLWSSLNTCRAAKNHLPCIHISWGWTRWHSAFLFKVSFSKQVSYLRFIEYHVFLHFCTSCWWCHCLWWPPSVMLKCCLMFHQASCMWLT